MATHLLAHEHHAVVHKLQLADMFELVFDEMEVDHDVCPPGGVRALESVFDSVNDDAVFLVIDQPCFLGVPPCNA